jgi:hypothetical protein
MTWRDFPWHFANGQWWSCCGFQPVQHSAVLRYLTEGSLEIILPPLLVYAVGAALFWAFRVLWEWFIKEYEVEEIVGYIFLGIIVSVGWLIFDPHGFHKSFTNLSGFYPFTQHDLGDCISTNIKDMKSANINLDADKIRQFCGNRYSTDLSSSSISKLIGKMGPDSNEIPQFVGNIDNQSPFLITKLQISIRVGGKTLTKTIPTWLSPGENTAVDAPLTNEEASLFRPNPREFTWYLTAKGVKVSLD